MRISAKDRIRKPGNIRRDCRDLPCDLVVDHIFADVFDTKEESDDIDIEHSREVLSGHIVNMSIVPDADGVDKEVDRPERLIGESDKVFDILLISNIGLAEADPVLSKSRFFEQG